MTVDSRDLCPDPELITALVDGELEPDIRDVVVAHLVTCADCRAFADRERQVKSHVHELSNAAPSPELLARLLATPDVASEPSKVTPLASRRRAPAMLGAAASVAVFMVGAFAFIGASAQQPGPSVPAGTTAIVPAADRLAQEHAVTTSQDGLAGPGFSTVSVSIPQPAQLPAVAP